jgi:hypothetical protein
MNLLKHILRAIFCAAVIAAAVVIIRSAPNGVDSDIISLLFPSGKNLLTSLTERSAKTINILFEGKNKKDVIETANDFAKDFNQKYSIKETLAKINRHKDGLLSLEARNLILSNRTDIITQNAAAAIFGFSVPLFPIKEDPFLLASSYITSLQSQNASGWNLENGLPVKSDGTNSYALLSIDSS